MGSDKTKIPLLAYWGGDGLCRWYPISLFLYVTQFSQMAVAKPLIPSLSSHHPSKLKTRASTHHHLPWLGRAPTPLRPKRLVVRVTSSSILDPLSSALVHHQDPSSSLSYLFLLADSTSVGYSTASYYTSLGLFVISVPGLWSLIKRSVKSKVRYHFIQDNFFFII